LLSFILEPEKVCRIRLNKLASRKILDNLGSESISDIPFFFLLFNNYSLEIDELYSPIAFSAINDYPNVITEKDLEKLPYFQSNNVFNVIHHVSKFWHCIHRWCRVTHKDVKVKLFILSFEDDSLDWFTKLKDNQVKTTK
jgi:hypothetical protein